MRALKALAILIALVLLARYFPVLYYSTVFNDLVKQEAQRARAGSQLRRALLEKAELYFLPVKPDDIRIKEDGERLQVNVDYKVPVDLFVFTHELSFHAAAVGIVVH